MKVESAELDKAGNRPDFARFRARWTILLSLIAFVGFARRVADLVVFMHRGKVWEIGPTAELFSDPKTAEFRQFVGSEL